MSVSISNSTRILIFAPPKKRAKSQALLDGAVPKVYKYLRKEHAEALVLEGKIRLSDHQFFAFSHQEKQLGMRVDAQDSQWNGSYTGPQLKREQFSCAEDYQHAIRTLGYDISSGFFNNFQLECCQGPGLMYSLSGRSSLELAIRWGRRARNGLELASCVEIFDPVRFCRVLDEAIRARFCVSGETIASHCQYFETVSNVVLRKSIAMPVLYKRAEYYREAEDRLYWHIEERSPWTPAYGDYLDRFQAKYEKPSFIDLCVGNLTDCCRVLSFEEMLQRSSMGKHGVVVSDSDQIAQERIVYDDIQSVRSAFSKIMRDS